MKQNEGLLGIDYTRRVLEPEGWRNKAEELWAAAQALESGIDELWKSFDPELRSSVKRPASSATNTAAEREQSTVINCSSVYFMLVAFALENLCKSMLACDPHYKDRNLMKALPSEFKTHELRKLLEKIGFALDHNEPELVDRLTRSSKWAGRYHVPVEMAQNRANIKFLGPKPYWSERFGKDDVQRIHQLVRRVQKYVHEPQK